MKVKKTTITMQKFMSNPGNRPSRLGFSLIELLLSIAVLSVITTLLYNAFFQVSESTKKARESLEAAQELRLLMKIVLDDLQAAQYLTNLVSLNDPDESIFYQSGIIAKRRSGPNDEEAHYIDLHTAIPTRFSPQAIIDDVDPELHEVGYFLEYEANLDQWFFKRREDFYIDNDMTSGGKTQILSENVVEFKLRFMSALTQKADGTMSQTWTDDWDSDEGGCGDPKNPNASACLPVVLTLTMSLQRENEEKVTDTFEVNLLSSLQRY